MKFAHASDECKEILYFDFRNQFYSSANVDESTIPNMDTFIAKMDAIFDELGDRPEDTWMHTLNALSSDVKASIHHSNYLPYTFMINEVIAQGGRDEATRRHSSAPSF